jgi:hypothetical protein
MHQTIDSIGRNEPRVFLEKIRGAFDTAFLKTTTISYLITPQELVIVT